MNSASYEKLCSLSRGKFSPQQFIQLKELASNTVGFSNSIFDIELNSLLALYQSLDKEIHVLETEVHKLIEEVNPHYMSILVSVRYRRLSSTWSTETSLIFSIPDRCLPLPELNLVLTIQGLSLMEGGW